MHSRIPVLVMVSALLGLPGSGGLAQKTTDQIIGDKWQGTIHSEMTTTYHVGAGGSCAGEVWDYDLTLVVAEEWGTRQTVQGKAVGHLVSPPKCSFTTNGPQARNRSADVSGKFVDFRFFELQFKRTSNDGATFGVDSLLDVPGNEEKVIVRVRAPGVAQDETTTTRTVATGVGTGHHKLTLKLVDCDPKYRLTPQAVTQAIEKALRERHVTLPSWWHPGDTRESPAVQNQPGPGGWPEGPVPDSAYGKRLSLLITPEQHSDVWILGTVRVPCMDSSGGPIIVHLTIWRTKVSPVDGHRFPDTQIEEVQGSGDDSQKGLDDAMRKALDAAKLDQYKSSGPPS
jgi:hypothetical protein